LGGGALQASPSGAAPFQVVCDMVTEGGGWIDLVASFQATGDAQALLAHFFVTNGPGFYRELHRRP